MPFEFLFDQARASRRALLLAALGGVSVAAAACGGGDEDETPTPEPPTPTPEPTPEPTQSTISTPVAGYADVNKWSGRTLTIAGWGGDYQDAQEAAFFDPFSLATGAGIQIKIADIARLREQVDEESVSWDLLTLPMEEAVVLAREGYLEPIDYAMVDKSSLFPEIVQPFGVGAAFFSTVIVFPAGSANAPQSWVDFWDVPPVVPDEEIDPIHLRALRRSPVGTLEFALIADGVAVDALYPLDVDRAFASLDRIRDHVVVWYEDGKQPIELVVSGQTGMASAWNVRSWQLGLENEIRVQWYGGMLSADAWVVPKGAPNRDVAMDFINYATRAVPSANFARLVPFGPVNVDSLGLLLPERADQLPNSLSHRSVQFVQDWEWWADHETELTARFEEWLLAEPGDASPEASA